MKIDEDRKCRKQVGTVLNTKDAEKAKNAGAKFIMSPAIGILDQNSDDLLYIPGVMTPTEILSSYNAGAKIVKIYPVSAIGGAQYIATLKKPFPHIPIVVSQGITTDSVGAYIDEGASAVVLSDAIFDKKAVSQRNFSAIYELAQYAALQVNEAVKRANWFFDIDSSSCNNHFENTYAVGGKMLFKSYEDTLIAFESKKLLCYANEAISCDVYVIKGLQQVEYHPKGRQPSISSLCSNHMPLEFHVIMALP
ncbi:hypothetical protein E3N88_34184 [Mikania micrantha]|uniref:Uncharacterized protein n=1 Tax=Mikania micrantha TaxID=192012 RepID=A0A5N6ME46_9ASTR|nr:hypothetical protein E3N88_34184 [Mikania micrantha]